MKNWKAKIGAAVCTAALAVTSVTPAMAAPYNGHNQSRGIKAEEVIAGAVIIGGLAVILSAADNNDNYRNSRYDERYDDRYGNGRHDNVRYDNGRRNVEKCVRAAEGEALRYGRNARVTDVREVDRYNGQVRVKGNVAVYSRHNGTQNNRFSCTVSHGRVQSVNIHKAGYNRDYGHHGQGHGQGHGNRDYNDRDYSDRRY